MGLLLVCVLLGAPDGADIDRALQRVLEADEYQTTLPPRRPQPENRDPSVEVERSRDPAGRPSGRPSGSGGSSGESRPARGSGSADLAPVGTALVWILFGVLGIAVAVWIAKEIRARQRAKEAMGDAPAATPGPAAPAAAPLADHERLALAGHFAEAIHAILLAVLARIGAAHAGLRPAWTSREILRIVKLEEAAQRALASLVGLVEVTRFGGAPAREGEYRQALSCLGTIGGPR